MSVAYEMPALLPAYIGYDRRENVAFQVCRFSIERRTIEIDVPVLPLIQDALRAANTYVRPIDLKATTDFSLTRFSVPLLQFYQGWALFSDCDFLFTNSLAELYKLRDETKAVMVVQHDYIPKTVAKMDKKKQTLYPRKNWSSLILWNCAHPSNRSLTRELLNTAKPAYLHRFGWLDESEIGELPLEWNFLAGEYPKPDRTPSAIHYTLGGPWFTECENVDYGDLWNAELRAMKAWDHKPTR